MWKSLLLTASLISGLAVCAAQPKVPFDKAQFESYLRNLSAWGPQYTIKVEEPVPSVKVPGYFDLKARVTLGNNGTDFLFYLSPDGKHFINGSAFDLNVDPFQADREKLKTEFQPSFGTPGAPVVIVEFSDFECPYCRGEAKMIREKLLQNYPKEIRFYFKDFPLEEIHDWAKSAAMAGRCILRQSPNPFWDFHDYIFENQPSINAKNLRSKVDEFAKAKNLDAALLGTCLDTNATEAEVEKSRAEAKAMGLDSTPTLFFNGRKVAAPMSWEGMKAVIDFELDKATKSGKAGEESCCTTEIKSLIPK